jgi:hypothetical protein
MEPWLIAVILRPFGAFLYFGLALVIAHAIRPLIPNGRIKVILYDRTLRKRHPWRFFLGFAVVFYGTIAVVWKIVV